MEKLRNLIVFLFLVLLIIPLHAQIKPDIRDEAGRQLINRGFVVNTNDGKGEIFFDSDDYKRMVRMGANTQVIRLELGKLSTFLGAKVEKGYLTKLDSLVTMGRHAGMETILKMTVYGVKGFSWEEFWLNKNNEHETYINAWKLIWDRYKDDPSVMGYDIVNEPRKLTMDISYDDLTSDYLIPLYQKIIDESNKINPDKKILVQSIFMNKGEAINHNQYAEIKSPINRDNIIFAPHIYQHRVDYIEPIMKRFAKEANMLDAPIIVGEWGFPTFQKTDTLITGDVGQLSYREFYIRTAEVFDRMGLGAIKAWFLGNRTMQNFLSEGPSTWAIFSDKKGVGTVERKYITDIIARPYPQSIAGDINSFMFDFATRTLDVKLNADNSKGASEIFIGANRHYPDGFSIIINDDFVMHHNPLKNVGLEVYKSEKNSNPSDFIWDSARQQIVVLKWPEDNSDIHLKIVPGIINYK